jgi:hypothetical protein
MNAEYRRKRTLELIDLVLMHDPKAPIGLLTEVITDWGELFDGEQVGAASNGSSAAPANQQRKPWPNR